MAIRILKHIFMIQVIFLLSAWSANQYYKIIHFRKNCYLLLKMIHYVKKKKEKKKRGNIFIDF